MERSDAAGSERALNVFIVAHDACKTSQQFAERLRAIGKASAKTATSTALQFPEFAGVRGLRMQFVAAPLKVNTDPVFHRDASFLVMTR